MKVAIFNLVLAAMIASPGCRPAGPPVPIQHQQVDAPLYRPPIDDPMLVRLAAGATQPDNEDRPPRLTAAGPAGTIDRPVGTVDDFIASRLADRLGLLAPPESENASNGQSDAITDQSDAAANQPQSPDASLPSVAGKVISTSQPNASHAATATDSPAKSPMLKLAQSDGSSEPEPARLVMPRLAGGQHTPTPILYERPLGPAMPPTTGPGETVAPASAPRAVPPAHSLTSAPLGSAAVTIGGRVFTGDEVLRPIWGELDRLAMRSTPQTHYRDALALVSEELRLTIAEHLVSQQAEQAMTEEVRTNVDKVITERMEEQARAMYGGSMRLMKQAWAHQGLDPDKEIEKARRQMLVQAFLREKFTPQLHVSRPEAYAYYQKHMDKFSQTPRARVKLITISPVFPQTVGVTREDRLAAINQARKRAAAVCDQIRAGKVKFDEAASQYSDSSTVDLGLVSRGGLRAKKVEEAAFTLPVGQVSDVIDETIDGSETFYLVLVTESVPLKVVPFSEAVNKIVPKLEREKFTQQSNEYMRKLYQQAGVTDDQIARFLEDCYKVVPKPSVRP